MLYPLGLLLPILIALTISGLFKSWRESLGKRGSAYGAIYWLSWLLCMVVFFKIVRWHECRADVAAYGECPARTGPEGVFDVFFFVPGSFIATCITFLIAYAAWFRKPSNEVGPLTKAAVIIPVLVVAVAFAAFIKASEPEPFQQLVKSEDGKTYLLIEDYGYGNKCGLLVDGKPWQFKESYKDGERGPIGPGRHTLKCKNIYGVGTKIEIPTGFIFRYSAFRQPAEH